MSNKICMVTGVNMAIGLEIARMLAGSGAHVILTSSSLEKARQIQSDIKKQFVDASTDIMKLNLEDLKSIRIFVEDFNSKYDHLDVLVNNAAVYQTSYKKSTHTGLEKSFTYNHLGVFLLTTLLLPTLERSSLNPTDPPNSIAGPRIVMITSDVYYLAGPLKIEDLDSANDTSFQAVKDQLEVYGRTKLCNLLFAEELNTRIKEIGSKIIINSVQAACDRDLGFGSIIDKVVPQYPASDGALCALFVSCEPTLNGKSGKCYVEPFKEVVLRDFACNQKTAKDLWDHTERLVDYTLRTWF